MPSCPECGASYEKGISRCPDCAVDLIDSLPTIPEQDEETQEHTAVAYEADDEVEADMISQVLSASGIANSLVPNLTHSIFPLSVTKLARVRLQVLEHQLDAAQRVIAEFKSGSRKMGSDE
jgi:hypothetical protein